MVGFLCSRTRLLSASLLFVSLSILAGCGGGPGDKFGSVEGMVKIDGSPANSGNVTFTVGETKVSGPIDPEGKYRAVGVPVGDAEVTVTPAAAQAAPKTTISPNAKKDSPTAGGGKDALPGGPPVVSKPVPIPDKYKSAAGGLKFKVKSGTNKWDIELTK